MASVTDTLVVMQNSDEQRGRGWVLSGGQRKQLASGEQMTFGELMSHVHPHSKGGFKLYVTDVFCVFVEYKKIQYFRMIGVYGGHFCN